MLKKISHGCSYHLVQSPLVNAEPEFLHFIPTGADISPAHRMPAQVTAQPVSLMYSPTTHNLRGFFT